MAVYVSNLTVNAGTTFSQIFTLESASTNSATDLTGFSVLHRCESISGINSTDFSTTNYKCIWWKNKSWTYNKSNYCFKSW